MITDRKLEYNSLYISFTLGKIQFCSLNLTENINITEIDTVITTKNYPRNYPDKSECKISIKLPNNTLAQLQFQEFHVDEHQECKNDWIQINGSIINETALLSSNATIKKDNDTVIRICGSISPPPITINGSTVDLLFRSDQSISKRGVKMVVTNGMN